jgi:hypothetical protein
VILQVIRQRGGWVGKLIAGIFGIAWTYVTFFIIPVLIYEKKEPLPPLDEVHHYSNKHGVRPLLGHLGLALSLSSLRFLVSSPSFLVMSLVAQLV